MNKLSNDIYVYYVSHFDELTFDKQLHFASRVHLWRPHEETAQLLKALKPKFTANNNPKKALDDVVAAALNSAPRGSEATIKLRAPYFAKYHKLRAYSDALFRILFLQELYDIDCRQLFYEHFPHQEVEACVQKLKHDKPALAMLSTPAINFLYLYERLVKNNFEPLELSGFMPTAEDYDLTQKAQLQLYIYLYTHAILADSLYYTREIPEESRTMLYNKLITELEACIVNNYSLVNLDGKFEFLVASRLIGHSPEVLEARIWEEAIKSLSKDGDFIVDRHNSNAQYTTPTISNSEHRNVLCILAGTPRLARSLR